MATPQQNEQICAAAKAGDLPEVQRLAEAGAEIDQRGKSGPLFLAAHNGQVRVLEWLLEKGAPVDSLNGKKSTPLMAAAEQGRLDCVKILLKAGADPAIKNDDNMNARAYAAHREKKDVVAWLDRNPEEVIFSRRVADRTMQEIFNFTHMERVTLIRQGRDGAVEAITRHSFSEIADKSVLRRAFEEYARNGGMRSEEDVFYEPLQNAC